MPRCPGASASQAPGAHGSCAGACTSTPEVRHPSPHHQHQVHFRHLRTVVLRSCCRRRRIDMEVRTSSPIPAAFGARGRRACPSIMHGVGAPRCLNPFRRTTRHRPSCRSRRTGPSSTVRFWLQWASLTRSRAGGAPLRWRPEPGVRPRCGGQPESWLTHHPVLWPSRCGWEVPRGRAAVVSASSISGRSGRGAPGSGAPGRRRL